ncbi:acyl-CoA dehydrogenase [Haloechinothrix alba]|uniref:Acyl-CoA dehydrogenase n=1 Tax=Haloechinothrix alba TaxID=664784 RepID=A0A238VUY4_9PSEU|nr:acyl-CoA dehydrogenase family protein [Haloechinothrix alba]SNR38001.1 acyl-CoA dehydrogenase [Haloechinothrix alba]
MAIDFTLTAEQQEVQRLARDFAQNVLAPITEKVDQEPDPLTAFQMVKPAYAEACKQGIAFSMLPKEYGGGGLSNVDFVIAAEEIQAVDPGFGTTVLVNGLGLMPVWYYGTEEQKKRFIGGATSDTSGEFIVGYAASEPPGMPGGTANFDAPAVGGAGMNVTAVQDGDDIVLNGRKYWPCNVGGWDNLGANLNLVIARTDRSVGGTAGLSAIVVERGTPGVTYRSISTSAQRSAPNCEIVFDNARVPAANVIEGARGNGDLVINRNFAWSGPVAGIGAVAVARSAYEDALRWAKTYTAGGPKPIFHYQYPGYVLGDVATQIEAARYFCWKGAHYLDQHDYHGEALGAMCKVHCTEMLFDCVYKCMQVVGVNSVDKKTKFDRYLREAALLPLYDAGNFGMQRRRVHGVMADENFNPRAFMDDEAIEFTKGMEGIDTIPGPTTDEPAMARS